MEPRKLRVAVHKFASCDGCQLAFLNAGEALLALSERVDFVHFAELGPVDPEAEVDVAFIEGSVCTREERDRLQRIRAHSHFLISLGACATAGGLQALRNLADGEAWLNEIYPRREYLDALATATPLSEEVTVDLAIWGCPVNGEQVFQVIAELERGLTPRLPDDPLCLECKRRGAVCTLVTQGRPCLGPVTRGGCGALCPRFGRDCYGCFGPSEHPNTEALGRRFEGLGLIDAAIARRFLFINSAAPAFREAGLRWGGRPACP